jgi:hypothetical protein
LIFICRQWHLLKQSVILVGSITPLSQTDSLLIPRFGKKPSIFCYKWIFRFLPPRKRKHRHQNYQRFCKKCQNRERIVVCFLKRLFWRVINFSEKMPRSFLAEFWHFFHRNCVFFLRERIMCSHFVETLFACENCLEIATQRMLVWVLQKSLHTYVPTLMYIHMYLHWCTYICTYIDVHTYVPTLMKITRKCFSGFVKELTLLIAETCRCFIEEQVVIKWNEKVSVQWGYRGQFLTTLVGHRGEVSSRSEVGPQGWTSPV